MTQMDGGWGLWSVECGQKERRGRGLRNQTCARQLPGKASECSPDALPFVPSL